MAYGMQIQTSTGLTDVTNIRVGRYLKTLNYTAQTGSVVVNDFTDANGAGHISCIPNDNKLTPVFTWTEGSKTLTWKPAPDSSGIPNLINNGMFSSNFKFIFWLFN